MKKITIYFMMLLSVSAFAQIEIVENFDSTSNGQVPSGWTDGGVDATTSFACGGSGLSTSAGFTATGQSASMTTPNYTAISNGTNLTVSFSVNAFEQVSQFPPPSFSPPSAGWGSIVLEYTTDGTNWTAITTIDDSNFSYVDTATCVSTGNISVGTIPNGSDFQARFVVTAGAITNFALQVFIDNVSITQEAVAIPNCDTVLVSPTNGSDTADIDTVLTWQAATGLPTGYTLSVGTTSGGTDIVNEATATETSFTLTGLTYETEYFVNIVPFNGIGDAIGCTEESFFTRIAPIPGATCSSPIVVSSFPFIEAGGDTNDYEDNIDVSPCNNGYMRGKDVFYEITPSSDVSINIDLANISNNGPSIHVVNGCPDAATECVDYVGVFNSGGSLGLSEVVLLAGNTYFVVLSNSGSTRTYTYDLIITENSCINPTIGSLTPVSDCGNGQFSVDVDITYLGDATTLTLSDDDATTADVTGISATGVVTVGPYASGSLVNFTLTNDQDGTCSFDDSVYFYCPPPNDECSAPISLTVNTDDTCTVFTSASNAGGTESILDVNTCAPVNNNKNDVWFSFVATSESTILEYLNVVPAPGYLSGGTIQATELLEGSCGTLTSINCFTGDYVVLNDLTIGNTYYIRNNTRLNGEYAQNFDICLKEPLAAPINDDCINAIALTLSTDDMCNNQTSGTTLGATESTETSCPNAFNTFSDVWYVFTPAASGVYEFSLERLSTSPTSNYIIYEGTCGGLTQLSGSCTSTSNQIISLNSSADYYVRVRTSQTGPGIDFNLCVWQLPDPVVNSDCSGATTIAESSDLNGNNAISGNINVTDVAYYSPEGCASTSTESVWYSFTPQFTGLYNFDLTRVSGSANYTVYNTDDCSQADTNYVTGISSCFNSTTPRTGDLVAGNTYLVMVHSSSASEFEFFVYPDAALSIESNDFEAFRYFPNPVENTLMLEAKDNISNVSIYNMLGQQVITVNPDNMETAIDMNELNKGVYFVKVIINNAQKSFKVVKK